LIDFYQATPDHIEGDSILYSQRHEKHWLLGRNALHEILQKLRAKTFCWSDEQAFVSDLPNALKFGGCFV
jgi:hypothetical protein